MNICIYTFSNEMTLPTAISIYLVMEKKSDIKPLPILP